VVKLKVLQKIQPRNDYFYLLGIHCLFIFCLLFIPMKVSGAFTPTGQLIKQQGSGAPIGYGDYIGSSGGLDTYYSYYIEVPPGTGRLVLRIFDADVGLGAANDWTNDTFNTSVTYTIYDPNGNTVTQSFTTGSSTGPAGSDSSWLRIYRTNNPIAGHWELRVDMSSSVTTGNDMNGFGIRAVDPVNGLELNIYAHSYIALGSLGSGTTRTSTLYPFVTSGCTADWNDWDGDNGASTLCTISYRSRTGNFSGSFNGSAADAWLNTPLSGYTSDDQVTDYGIWRTRLTYTDTGAGGNFGVLYLGNYNAATPAPTGQPETDTFRIYFRSSTAVFPLKPFLVQNLSYVSGPNPPSNGSTTRIKIGVTIVNPTPQSITFSASNLITAYIPGSGAVYAGNATVSTGTITAQPSVGGTGSITWNPGTVTGVSSGYNSETLYYEVDVNPTSAGQRIPINGTPGTNGTTATYVDETGNTTQTRATFTFGPLCELAITEGGDVPTLAVISAFRAYEKGSRAVVQWETASEIGTAGFYLLRRDDESGKYWKVNNKFLPGLLNFPQGGIYRLIDKSAIPGETYTYKLIEVESRGNKRQHGPYTIMVAPKGMLFSGTHKFGISQTHRQQIELESMQGSYSKRGHQRSFSRKARRMGKKNTWGRIAGNKHPLFKHMAKIIIREKGLYFIASSDIAKTMGLSSRMAELFILNHKFELYNRGNPVAWEPASWNSGIIFYGESIESIYSRDNVYWLKRGNGGLKMKQSFAWPPKADYEKGVFTDTLHLEEDHYTLTALFNDPSSDFWLWDYVLAEGEERSFQFQLFDVANEGEASILVHLKGATSTEVSPDHYVQISLNGTPVGQSQFNGTESHTFRVTFNQSLLINGDNTVKVSGLKGEGVEFSIFYVDSFDLFYNRYYQAHKNYLFCKGKENKVITVEGFTDPNIMVLDITNPLRPKMITGVTIDGAYQVSFKPDSYQKSYLVVSTKGLLSPFSVVADKPSGLKNRKNSAQYIVIAPNELLDSAQNLAVFRKRRGFKSKVVGLEDIYDEFNFGISSPIAIKRFLSYAYRNWIGSDLLYVVLAGKGTFDYKNNLGYNENLVPTNMVSTPQGLFASDSCFGDIAGRDGIPEIAIGRIPVLTNEELQDYIDKMADYEYSSGQWTRRFLMVADHPDEKNDFPADSENLAQLVKGYELDKIYLPEFGIIEEAREQFFESFNSGAMFINYLGHAGLNHLSKSGLFWSEGVSLLENSKMYPIMTAMTCVMGRFSIPGFDTLSEILVLSKDSGTIAVWAPTGASQNEQAKILAGEFFKAVFSKRVKNLGKIILKAMQGFIELGGQTYMLNIFNLIGDPALRIK